jgi:hypothetical protein
MDLREKGLEGQDGIHMAHDRKWWQAVMNTLMDLRIPEKTGNFLTS